jgi:hypothetical protein
MDDKLQLCNIDAGACTLRFLRRNEIKKIGKASQAQCDELNALWRRSGEQDERQTGHPTQYEEFITKQFSEWRPAIPNMHAELMLSGKGTSEEPDTMNNLINWGKIQPQAARCVVLNRFQILCHKFIVIPQIQRVIQKGSQMSAAAVEEKIEALLRKQVREQL